MVSANAKNMLYGPQSRANRQGRERKMMRNDRAGNCGCRGPRLRSYEHAAHERNRDLPTPPAGATVVLTERQARWYPGRKWGWHVAAGSSGGPCTPSTRHVVRGYRVGIIEADRWGTWMPHYYYAPGTVISAPDHPSLTLKKWHEIEPASRGGD